MVFHLKNEDFFNVAKYTTICFVSQSIVKKGSNYEAIGHLIMNGVTKKVRIEEGRCETNREQPQAKKA